MKVLQAIAFGTLDVISYTWWGFSGLIALAIAYAALRLHPLGTLLTAMFITWVIRCIVQYRNRFK